MNNAYGLLRSRIAYGVVILKKTRSTIRFPVLVTGLMALLISACSESKQTRLHTSAATLYRILVLGDSITWGQGLSGQHKFTELVRTALARNHPERLVTLDRLAHSGAAIGLDADNTPDKNDTSAELNVIDSLRRSEIPWRYPIVWKQIDVAKGTHARYDLVLLSACINDIGISEVANPLPKATPISTLADNQCHKHLARLLDHLASSSLLMPSGKVIVLGYFPIFSRKSDRLDFLDMLKTVLANLSSHERKQLQAALHREESLSPSLSRARTAACWPKDLCDNMEQRTQDFAAVSSAAIATATKEANASLPQPLFIPVIPNITIDHSAYAGKSSAESWIWEIPRNGKHPIDEATLRPADCRTLYAHSNDLKGKAFCIFGSTGHPNRCGSVAYAQAVLYALHESWPEKPPDQSCG